MSSDVQEQIAKLQLRLAQLNRIDSCKDDFLTFVQAMWPEFIAGKHHQIISENLKASCIEPSTIS